MNKQGNTYTFLYSVVLVVVVAALLSIVSLSLQPRQNENRQNEKRQNILSAIHISSTAANSAELFDKYIKEQFIINSKGDRIEGKAFDVNIEKQYNLPVEKRELPVFVANVDGATKYILPIYGAGLWGPIWGYISLDDNKDTVYGTFFDHQGETPGLGCCAGCSGAPVSCGWWTPSLPMPNWGRPALPRPRRSCWTACSWGCQWLLWPWSSGWQSC